MRVFWLQKGLNRSSLQTNIFHNSHNRIITIIPDQFQIT